MSETASEKINSFHQELLSMQRLGIAFDIGFASTPQPLEAQLEQIHRRLEMRLQSQQDPAAAISREIELPSQYRTALIAWIHTDHPTEVLDGLTAHAVARREMHGQIGLAMLQPLIVIILLYFGCIYLCQSVIPSLEAVYAQMWVAPGKALRLVSILRTTMPIWIAVIPILVVAGIVWWYRHRRQGNSWRLWGDHRYHDSVLTATYATQVAGLLDAGVSVGQALDHAGPLPSGGLMDGGELAASNTYLIAAEGGEKPIATADPAIRALPPLLRWALVGECGNESRSNLLRHVAQLYAKSAGIHSRRQRTLLPMILSGGLGGLLVLGYGLSLFTPYVELLHHIAIEITR